MVKQINGALTRRCDGEFLEIRPWGKNSLRVRATQRSHFDDPDYGALMECEETSAEIVVDGESGKITNGKITCEMLPTGKLKFFNDKGELLLEEYDRNRFRENIEGEFNSALEINPRMYCPVGGTSNFRITVRFEAQNDEKIFGMGQYQQPFLDLKGCVLELAQRNSQASVPFYISSKNYGFLWNNPAIGSVTFGKNVTEWVSLSSGMVDYWITTEDTPSAIEEAYADVTGKVPMMPEYGMGFWQCKLRYQTQDEILKVAREYHRRQIPVDVIVVDYFHWPHQGDWEFDPEYWPNPEAMVRELNSYGMKLMVSVWPTVDEQSSHYREMVDLGLLVRSEHGKRIGQLGDACFIDVTNPETRHYVWDKIKRNYYDKGIRIFWLDEAEPEYTGYEFSNYRYFLGADLEIGNIYPREYARMAYEGMEAEGPENILHLLRCAWAGSQKYGALVWSGDIDSSFRALRNQLAAGLNMGIAGIPWWTTDIGGFHGGNIHDDAFKECFARWFAFGAFCPVFRLHGYREPFKEPLSDHGGGKCNSGAENEIWSYGEEIEKICVKYIQIREKMRPYIRKLMEEAHQKGTPVMRPLFYDFPANEKAWTTEDEYMFGPDILVCPVLYENTKSRKVYLPEGKWRELETGKFFDGDQYLECKTSLSDIPVFVRDGADVGI
jgi:alpha-D-xyloside xylohydrolase